jgi:phage/plasmid-associated DNA primase
VEEYRSEEDMLVDFIETCIRVDVLSTVPHSKLFEAYRQWAEESGTRYPLSSNALAKRLRDRGWRDTRTEKSKCVWRSVRLEGE